MSRATVLTRRLGLRHPVIQAPLAGGGDTPALVAAVCEAGALGFVGASYLTPLQIVETARAVRAKTTRPFGINLFAPLPAPEAPFEPELALKRLEPFYAELALPRPEVPTLKADAFGEQLAAALESGASVFSFTFGVLPTVAFEAIKARGMFVIGTATTVEEAVSLETAGVDAVVTQGSEAGAPRSTRRTGSGGTSRRPGPARAPSRRGSAACGSSPRCRPHPFSTCGPPRASTRS